MTIKTLIKPNEKQLECIENTEGKYLVLAGPGTGKTYTVVQRIKYMVEKGIEPEKILCLTFTESAANEMQARIEKELGKILTGVNVYTYHGFCYEIIETNPEDFELPENIKIISEAVSRAFVKECIDEINPKYFRTEKNDPYYYIDIIKDRIEEIKKNRLDRAEYFYNIEHNPGWKPKLAVLKNNLEEKLKQGKIKTTTLEGNIKTLEKDIEKAVELWQFYELYRDKMQKNHYLDFNDMISLVLYKFETSPAFLEKIANKYEYILVDEYQDTNKSQNAIVFNLTEALRSENVFVVGDDDQIIYAFQGAKLDTIEKFLQKFPDTKVICLEENMRSTQSILDTAREISRQDNNRLENKEDFKKYNINKKLIAKNGDLISQNKPVRCYKYADGLQEYTEIVNEIDELINSSACPSDTDGNKKLSEIAILTRTHAELETFAQMFKDRNIPFELKEGKNIFTIKSSIVLYFYMQMLVNPELHSDKIFKLLLSQPFNINPKDYEKLCIESSGYKSFITALNEIGRNNYIEPEKITNFIDTFNYLSKYKTNESLKNVVLETASKTGILDYYLNSGINRTENIAGLKKLIDEACAFSEVNKTKGLEDFVEYLDIALFDDIEIKTDKAPVSMNAVQLCTYYSAKGREFEYVYMPGLLSDRWESDTKSLRSKIPLAPSEYKNEQELKEMKRADRIKVIYVGMTRAKHTLRLSYPQKVNGKLKKPSELIVNIQDLLEKEDEPFVYNETSFWEEISKSVVKRDYDYEREFCSLVDNILKSKAFSPTSVNTYLKCPRQYFYNDVLNLSSKSGNADNMHYGTAVHNACKFAVDYAKTNGEYPPREEFLDKFKTALLNLPLSRYEQRDILNVRGQNALSEYYAQLCSTPVSMLYAAEEKILLEIDGVKFKGYIDRIDQNPDGTFTIYDYKTGKAKNDKIICPEGEHEDYYNQIALYKYYFEKATGKKVKETTFIFPEEFTKNLTLNLTDNECEAVYHKFKNAISKIKNYKFEPAYDKNVCNFCQYKEFCSLETV